MSDHTQSPHTDRSKGTKHPQVGVEPPHTHTHREREREGEHRAASKVRGTFSKGFPSATTTSPSTLPITATDCGYVPGKIPQQ